MDFRYIWPDGRYKSKVFISTIPTSGVCVCVGGGGGGGGRGGDLGDKVTDLEFS